MSERLLVARWSAFHRIIKPIDVSITSEQLLFPLTLNLSHLLHQLHLPRWVGGCVLQCSFYVYSLRVLHGSVHNGFMVKRARDYIHSLLLVLIVKTVLLKQPLICTHVLPLKPHPRVDRLETVNDTPTVVSSLTQTSPLVQITTHSGIQHLCSTHFRELSEVKNSRVSEISLSMTVVLAVVGLVELFSVLLLG